ncbi:MAG: hypothetical protein ACT4QA_00680 [Panacagrimonas sp.]
MKSLRARFAPVLLLVVSGLAPAADPGECVSISDDVVRLFCYDRAAGRVTEPVPSNAAGDPAETSKPVTPGPPPAPTISTPTPEPAPAAVESAPQPNPRRIEARIVGRFEGWSSGTRFVLDNGQIWEVVGAGTHYSKAESPKVVIERDFIGQTLMSVEGIKSRALVRRVDR